MDDIVDVPLSSNRSKSEKRKKEDAIEGRLDEERRIKISMKDTWFVSHDYETAKVNNSRLESYGWGIH